jgi:hypothetical protein
MDWGRIAAGVATGGQSELFRAGMGLLNGGGQTGEMIAYETPEQRSARRALLEFSQTGKFGKFDAGAEVPLGYGDYRMGALEEGGLSSLQDLLRSGIPAQYRLGDEALRDILTTGPAAIDRDFEPFRAQVERSMRDADTNLRRGAGFTGNLYSTDTIRGLGDIQARGQETLTAELARLTNAAQDRRLAAIPLAYQSAAGQENLAMGRVAASQQFGGLARQLNDASIKARDTELLRRRTELQLPIQAATAVAGGPPQFGPAPVEQSPYQELLNMVGQVGGQYLGNEIFGAQNKRIYGGRPPASSSWGPGSGVLL